MLEKLFSISKSFKFNEPTLETFNYTILFTGNGALPRASVDLITLNKDGTVLVVHHSPNKISLIQKLTPESNYTLYSTTNSIANTTLSPSMDAEGYTLAMVTSNSATISFQIRQKLNTTFVGKTLLSGTQVSLSNDGLSAFILGSESYKNDIGFTDFRYLIHYLVRPNIATQFSTYKTLTGGLRPSLGDFLLIDGEAKSFISYFNTSGLGYGCLINGIPVLKRKFLILDYKGTGHKLVSNSNFTIFVDARSTTHSSIKVFDTSLNSSMQNGTFESNLLPLGVTEIVPPSIFSTRPTIELATVAKNAKVVAYYFTGVISNTSRHIVVIYKDTNNNNNFTPTKMFELLPVGTAKIEDLKLTDNGDKIFALKGKEIYIVPIE